jgi:HAD superfamily phosphoserine phosphatase-like hydrolase
MEVQLFDFDFTIYSGDSSLDFYLHCLRRKPQIIRFLPKQAWHWAGYMLGVEGRTKGRSGQYSFLRGIDDVDRSVAGFWHKNWHKVRFPTIDKPPTKARVIISASPEFLLASIAKRLQAHQIIATRIDKRSGQLISKDCYGVEKVARFRAEVGDVKVREAYSDSLSDLPMLQLADKAYIVKHHKVLPLKQYLSLSPLRRLLI